MITARDSCSIHGAEVAIGVIIVGVVPRGVGDRFIIGVGVRKRESSIYKRLDRNIKNEQRKPNINPTLINVAHHKS